MGVIVAKVIGEFMPNIPWNSKSSSIMITSVRRDANLIAT
jgi:hypothetical protein